MLDPSRGLALIASCRSIIISSRAILARFFYGCIAASSMTNSTLSLDEKLTLCSDYVTLLSRDSVSSAGSVGSHLT